MKKSYKVLLEELDNQYSIKNTEYWIEYRKLHDEVNTRLNEVDINIFPKKLF